MFIELERQNDFYHFTASNSIGCKLELDASPEIGGCNKGFRPMESLLAGLGGCSAIDMISILKKQRQEIEDVKIQISATRKTAEIPSIFETIQVHFIFWGKIEHAKIEKALALTQEKYCSVHHILQETAKIKYSFEVREAVKKPTKLPHFETAAIRTQIPQTAQKEHSSPLFLSSSFCFEDAEEARALFANEKEGNIYSRFSNPNTDELVHKMCLLENCEAGIATASGMAAMTASILPFLKSGDHIVASRSLFGNTYRIITEMLPNWNIEYSLVSIDNLEEWEKAIRPNTKMLLVESPSNPALDFADIKALGLLAKKHNLILNVDNCFATPFLQQPSQLGADLIVHSATKWIDGQGRVLGGLVLGKKELIAKAYNFTRSTGPALSPFNAWILSKSLETLALRMVRHCENARLLALFLQNHSEIEWVKYPHLSSHPQYQLAKEQMKLGGGIVCASVKGGLERGRLFLNSLNLFSMTANLGDSRSIATHPASTTHSKLSEAQRLEVGISPGLLRFSVGLEHIDDIIEDIRQALEKSKIS